MKKFIARFLSTKYLIKKRDENFRLRMEGEKPDKWYWADVELMRRGIFGK